MVRTEQLETLGHTRSPTPHHLPSLPPPPSHSQECIYHRFYRPSRQQHYLFKRRLIHKHGPKPPQQGEKELQPYRRTMASRLGRREGDLRWTDLPSLLQWMMEMASLLRITKNAYYRAIVIVRRLKEQPTSPPQHKINQYLCAALCLGAKLECSTKDYLHSAQSLMAGRVTKHEIVQAEFRIAQMIHWRFPLQVFVEEEFIQLLNHWNEHVEQHNTGSGGGQLRVGMGARQSMRHYIEVVHILDHIVTRKPQYLDRPHHEPILIALYVVLSLSKGDHFLTHKYLWQTFHHFLTQRLKWGEEQSNRLLYRAVRQHNDLRLHEALGGIPLVLSYESLIRSRMEQWYLQPINPI